MKELLQKARAASRTLATLSTAQKNTALLEIARYLQEPENVRLILAENKKDTDAAEKSGITAALLDRLTLTEPRLAAIAASVLDVAELPDPVGQGESFVRPNGLKITNTRVPMGVVAVIYEARPNVTVDTAALCVKSGNAAVLRGSSSAINSNRAISAIMRRAAQAAGLPEDAISFIDDTSRETTRELMTARGLVDLLLPRGGSGLINFVCENSTVPVIQTGAGVCHVFVDKSADIEMAADIAFNAKCSRPSVCNAAETLLIHRDIAAEALPVIAARLAEKNTELRGCPETVKLLPQAVPATEEDWGTEYGDFILSVRVVGSLDEAVEHIARYSTGHSEAIVTRDYAAASEFTERVDSACVYVNASTRFTDGGEFGFGSEIGISTQKLHVRGPVGLRHLVTNKYIILGSGQVR
jgi:glutamate-5-semialdehyde dehydrogenase